MEIEIPEQLYEQILEEMIMTGSTVEEIVERAFKNYIERNENIAD